MKMERLSGSKLLALQLGLGFISGEHVFRHHRDNVSLENFVRQLRLDRVGMRYSFTEIQERLIDPPLSHQQINPPYPGSCDIVKSRTACFELELRSKTTVLMFVDVFRYIHAALASGDRDDEELSGWQIRSVRFWLEDPKPFEQYPTHLAFTPFEVQWTSLNDLVLASPNWFQERGGENTFEKLGEVKVSHSRSKVGPPSPFIMQAYGLLRREAATINATVILIEYPPLSKFEDLHVHIGGVAYRERV